MKMLRSEKRFIEWMRRQDGWRDVPRSVLVAVAPNEYPCFGYFEEAGYDDYAQRYTPSYLYDAQVSTMLTELRAGP